MKSLLREMGLSPSARSTIVVTPPEQEAMDFADELAQELFGG
jgi:hypothetical protein